MLLLVLTTVALRIAPLSHARASSVLWHWHADALLLTSGSALAESIEHVVTSLEEQDGIVCVRAGARVTAIATLNAEPLTLNHVVAKPGDTCHGSVLVRALRAVSPTIAFGEELSPRWQIALLYYQKRQTLL